MQKETWHHCPMYDSFTCALLCRPVNCGPNYYRDFIWCTNASTWCMLKICPKNQSGENFFLFNRSIHPYNLYIEVCYGLFRSHSHKNTHAHTHTQRWYFSAGNFQPVKHSPAQLMLIILIHYILYIPFSWFVVLIVRLPSENCIQTRTQCISRKKMDQASEWLHENQLFTSFHRRSAATTRRNRERLMVCNCPTSMVIPFHYHY